MIRVGTDFSGIGAPEVALKSLGIEHEMEFMCEIDKYARKSYLAIHETPNNVYFDITKRDHKELKQLDLYVAGFPCQAFSIAGKGLGFEDTRGTLFFNVADFIKINQPKCFVLENVKGLVSHDSGRTFQTIIDVLSNGGGTVNGQMSLDVFEDGLGYHVYYQVLNTKDFGIPQNRERIFIVGFKEFTDFQFPKPFPLKLRLKDLLEDEVDEKYYLSDKMIEGFTGIDTNGISRTIRSGGKGSKTDKHNWDIIKEGYINQDTQASAVFDSIGVSPTLSAGTHGYAQGYVKVKSATKKGYEIATEEDSINFSVPNSETRRGRVGKFVPQTLDTQPNIAVIINKNEKSTFKKRNAYKTLLSMWAKIREEAFKKRGFREFTALQQEEILQSTLSSQKHGCYRGYKSESKSSSQHSKKYKQVFFKEEELREMWFKWENRYSSYRRELPKQHIKEFDGIMPFMSFNRTRLDEQKLPNRKLSKTYKSKRLLWEALSKIIEIRRSYFGEYKRLHKTQKNEVLIGAIRGRGENNQQQLEINETGNSNSLTTVQKDNVVVSQIIQLNNPKHSQQRIYSTEGVSPTISAGSNGGGKSPTKHLTSDYKIRKLTPLECWRLQHFPDEYFYKAEKVNSATQLYKQAGNSISTNVLERLFEKILPKITNTNN